MKAKETKNLDLRLLYGCWFVVKKLPNKTNRIISGGFVKFKNASQVMLALNS